MVRVKMELWRAGGMVPYLMVHCLLPILSSSSFVFCSPLGITEQEIVRSFLYSQLKIQFFVGEATYCTAAKILLLYCRSIFENCHLCTNNHLVSKRLFSGQRKLENYEWNTA